MTIRAPQVSDRVKEAPVRVLRAAFAGIGQLLLIADRRRSDRQPPAERPDPSAQDSPPRTGPAAATTGAEDLIPQPRGQRTATPPGPPAEGPPAASPPVRTIKVPRPASPPATAPVRPAGQAPPRAARPKRAAAAAAQPQRRSSERDRWRSLDQTGNVRLIEPGEADDDEQRAAAAVTAGPGPSSHSPAGGAPVAGYESWSVPSLRARLRTLNSAQVQALADYERATTGRTEVLSMFERRLAKLTGSQ